ncbi:MAG: hypothetical protein KBS74_04075 [Clostridiales bacterium]|nr:hypothetical protein [Candidatus Cacconaster stercorequi]
MSEISVVEKAAMHGEPMPVGLCGREVVEYIGLRYLYLSVKRGIITREMASKEKRQLIADLNGAEAAHEFDIKCWESAGRRYAATESARNTYRKNRTLENADKLMAALDGLEVPRE